MASRSIERVATEETEGGEFIRLAQRSWLRSTIFAQCVRNFVLDLPRNAPRRPTTRVLTVGAGAGTAPSSSKAHCLHLL